MLRHLILALTLTLYSVPSFIVPKTAAAQTSLTRGTIESLRNRVRLIPRNQSARAARRSDTITPGDALATAANSMADVRFNDRSLARLGEQAVFRFSPGLRTVDLTRGTMVLLVAPGEGRTNVRTPNSAAGIRGSALFVRYIPETDTTLIGALTNSGIEIFNRTGEERQELKAGQMAAIIEDRIDSIYNFDLETFYQTSPLIQDLNLTGVDDTISPDEPMARVRAEVQEGLDTQPPVVSTEAMVNPDFINLPAVSATAQTSAELQDFPEIPDFSAAVVDFDPQVLDGNTGDVLPNVAAFENSSNARSLLVGAETQVSIQRADFLTNFPGVSDPGTAVPGSPLPGVGSGGISGGSGGCNIVISRSGRVRIPPGQIRRCLRQFLGRP
ncbi:MAG: FecR family protein [Cyanobacteriota bacterium]|nr:FecR family protein [Cyanobacteriota bacterium]